VAALRKRNMLTCPVRGIVRGMTVIRGHRVPESSPCIGDAAGKKSVL
jgi:hypothetical protein